MCRRPCGTRPLRRRPSSSSRAKTVRVLARLRHVCPQTAQPLRRKKCGMLVRSQPTRAPSWAACFSAAASRWPPSPRLAAFRHRWPDSSAQRSESATRRTGSPDAWNGHGQANFCRASGAGDRAVRRRGRPGCLEFDGRQPAEHRGEEGVDRLVVGGAGRTTGERTRRRPVSSPLSASLDDETVALMGGNPFPNAGEPSKKRD